MRHLLRAAGVAVLSLLFFAPGNISASGEQPMILALPYDDEVAALNWPVGTDVTLKIDDPGSGTAVDYQDTLTSSPADFDQHVGLAAFELDGIFDVRPGQQIRVSDGVTERVHTVTDLAVTGVDIAADTVSGTARPGSEVSVEVWRAPLWWYASRSEVVGAPGIWSADFSVPDDEPHQGALPHDFTRTTYGASFEWDDEPGPYRDATMVFWPFDGGNDAYAPQIVAAPSEDKIQGFSWPFGAEVTLSIDVPGGSSAAYTDAATVGEAQLDPGQTRVEFSLYGEFDVMAGQVVTLTDGVTTKSLTVAAGTVTAIDPESDTISGTATPGSDVDVDINVPGVGSVASRHEAAGGSGGWTSHFSIPGDEAGEDQVADIAYGVDAWVQIGEHDADGDVTVSLVSIAPAHGDANCDGAVNSIDALSILRSVAGLPVNQQPGCPMIGTY